MYWDNGKEHGSYYSISCYYHEYDEAVVVVLRNLLGSCSARSRNTGRKRRKAHLQTCDLLLRLGQLQQVAFLQAKASELSRRMEDALKEA